MRLRGVHIAVLGACLGSIYACSDDDGGGGGGGSGAQGGAAGSGGTDAGACPSDFEVGDPNGHADVYGAKAAGQARAGRLTNTADIVQPAHGRQRVEVGDFILVNDKIAVTIEDKGLSDGYARFGGEILAIDQVGEDGRPRGLSRYNETLMSLSIQMIDPTSVSVINDGSDGEAAVVRVTGPLTAIPFLNGALSALFPRRYEANAAYDYILEPGSERLQIRVGIANPGDSPMNIADGAITDEMHGFFQLNHSQFVSPELGFGSARGEHAWGGFISGPWNFAWRLPHGKKLSAAVEISGFQYFTGPGFVAEACAVTWNDHVELIGGGPDYDGLREAIRRVDEEAAWAPVTGRVVDQSGAPVAGAWVHAQSPSGDYLSRAQSGADGSYTVHVPSGGARLIPHRPGYPLGAGETVSGTTSDLDLRLEAAGKIRVIATDADSGAALPVRVQVIPSAPAPATPAAFGVLDEVNGRLHQEFAVTGDTTLAVPPGEHRVVVSRGFEWELSDTQVTVAAGATETINAVLERSVDSTGIMCADFHIHSHQSADSPDPVDLKVRSAVADGLEIPVSSEHEWVIDFQPVIEALGLADWAFGMPSEELTTFTWGHFGVVPLLPRADAVNNGAIEWIGLKPPEMFASVRALPENPVFIINHPSGGGFGAYFSAARLDRTTGEGRATDLWSTNFDAIEVFNDSSFDANRTKSVADWFALLNAGHTFWATGASDSHKVRTSPVGYPRTCMSFGHDDPRQLTINTVRDTMAGGASTISGGLLMQVEGPGGTGPGSTLSGSSEVDFTVTVQGPSWISGGTLEIIVDGETVEEQPLLPAGAGTGNRYVNLVTVSFDTSRPRSWVVMHVRGDGDLSPVHPGREVFAVANPIFFQD
ncbi:MAG: CehA/McbA family metallohydrolase [Polyangiaceae bacterium]|nr:CehA/McbA family metallohydrolase [Polyangiaceae bacterium]MCW5791019.1 CehA/McbA family metallohydrolase [Polyangiaceae bacterium]